MRRYGVILTFWALLIATAFTARYWLSYRPAGQEWRAARDLAAGRQIRQGDLAKPSKQTDAATLPPVERLVGYHLVGEKKSGEPIAPEEVVATPSLPPVAADESLVVFPLNAEELATAELVKGGDYVQPCTRDAPRVGQSQRSAVPPPTKCSGLWAQVVAIHRANALAPQDWLVLKVSRGEVPKVLDLASAGGERLVISSEKGAVAPPAGQDDRTPRIRHAQERLTALGFPTGPIDGMLGPRTRTALQQFQRANQLPVTGEVDDATWRAFGER